MGLAFGRARAAETGHDAVAVDLPSETESAGWWAYAGAVVEAVAARRNVIVVGHSLGGFTAPLVCARIPVDLLILVAAMIPAPGELFDQWWANAGYERSGLAVAESRDLRGGAHGPLERSRLRPLRGDVSSSSTTRLQVVPAPAQLGHDQMPVPGASAAAVD